jgi:glyoxylase-like metal-dependent hydrolase (beta-lactamase superfamily II)
MGANADGSGTNSAGAWPTDVYFTDSTQIYFNDEPVEILHMPGAHTDGDSVVHFRRSDIVSSGAVFITTGYPVIDLRRGVRRGGHWSFPDGDACVMNMMLLRTEI